MKKLLTIAAGLLLVVSVAAAQTITPPAKEPVKRTPLQKTEYPDGHVIIMQLLETDPNTAIARHTHPGVETSYVLEGEIELAVEGSAPLTVKAGESFAVPANTPHAGKVGAKPAKLIVTYVVDKTKPVATPAPQQ
ncbi:MAG TPA: cupin domain-containing protein [Hyphomicrobiaceae bacterium]|jgi:quercetin dioxygenase-like cupin family protein|nr:cupin domain-containing protein [Hyphomicrobiaceae bacterium]